MTCRAAVVATALAFVGGACSSDAGVAGVAGTPPLDAGPGTNVTGSRPNPFPDRSPDLAACGPTLQGSFEGRARRLDRVGDIVYVAEGYGGLFIFDVSDPTRPAHVGVVAVPGYAVDVSVSGAYAYLATDDGGLAVVDVSDPARPRLVATLATKGWTRAVRAAGDFVYLVDGVWDFGLLGEGIIYSGFQIVDVSDPASPRARGHIDLTADGILGQDIDVVGSDVFVAAGALLILDARDPDQPQIRAASRAPAASAFGVHVVGDRAVVAGFSGGLQLFDVADRDAPVPRGHLETDGYAYRVTVAGSHAFLADSNNENEFFDGAKTGLRIVDISDVDNPVLIESLDTPGDAFDVTVSGGHAFVADGMAGLQVIAVAPGSSRIVATQQAPFRIYDLEVAGEKLYITGRQLTIADVSDPRRPRIESTLPLAGKLDVSGSRVYVAENVRGLQVVDVSDTRSPVILAGAAVPLPGNAIAVCVDGARAYVASNTPSALYVLDLSNPDRPVKTGEIALPDYPSDVAADRGIVYVALGLAGLQIVDARDLTAPALRGSLGRRAVNLRFVDPYLYVAGGSGAGLDIVDVSDPAAPVLKGSNSVNGAGAHGLAVAGGFAYTGSATTGRVSIVDVSDVAHPVRVAGVYTGFGIDSVAAAGDHLFAGGVSSGRGLKIVDVAVKRASSVVARLDIGPSYLEMMSIHGSRAYLWIADGESYRLQILDLAEPAAPRMRGSLLFGFDRRLGAIDGRLAVISTDNDPGGIEIADIADPDLPVRIGALELTRVRAAVIAGDLVYALSLQELRIVDVAAPAAPTLVATLPLGGTAVDVRASGDHVYVTVDRIGLVAVDVSDRAAPRIVGSVATERRLRLSLGRGPAGQPLAYAYGGTAGVQIVDLSDPRALRTLATYPVDGSITSLHASGRHAYLGHLAQGLVVLDVSDPADPSVAVPSIAGFPDAGYVVAEKDGYAYVGTYSQLLTVAPFACPAPK